VGEHEAEIATLLKKTKTKLESRTGLLKKKKKQLHHRETLILELKESLKTSNDECFIIQQALESMTHEHAAAIQNATEHEANSRITYPTEVVLSDTENSAKLAAALERGNKLESELSSLVTSHSSLVAERDELATRHQALATERDALSSDISAKTTLLEVLTAGRVAQDEQLRNMLQEKQTLESQCGSYSARVTDLEKENADFHTHTKFLDEEFGKAEGQIELIKDIFLRESLR
jgi:chromosome segregation ATPase